MRTDKSIPYPRPDFSDPDLDTKEMVNGTFAKAVIDDVSHFRPVLDRYNVTENKLIERSLESGSLRPDAYDITMKDMTLAGVKEIAWQPYCVEDEEPEPEIVYNPLDYYSSVEWRGMNSTELNHIESSNNIGYKLYTIYYDYDNPGLFGFKEIKDDNGNVTSRYAAFFSLVTERLLILGRLPDKYNIADAVYVGYVLGAYMLRFNDDYISFRLGGGVHELSIPESSFSPLGDDGCIAIAAQGRTYIYNTKFEAQYFAPPPGSDDEPLPYKDGDYCSISTQASSGQAKYQFGTKIGRAYYFVKGESSSYKFKNTAAGWMAGIIDSPVWKYAKRLKYDYATDNWLHPPLKTLHYNMIAHGVFVKNKMPPHSKGDSIEFVDSGMYGDFVRVVSPAGARSYYHTYDFRKWEPITGDAADMLYGCSDRVWTIGRGDGIRGLMPYALSVIDVNDLHGGRKTVLQFEGFIFRGGA
jgi:hypothetical protein